jgi:hypothetical protein
LGNALGRVLMPVFANNYFTFLMGLPLRNARKQGRTALSSGSCCKIEFLGIVITKKAYSAAL